MTVVVKREYVPIPKGIYNLRIESYEEKEKLDKTGYYYAWKIAVVDALPEEFTGRNTFNVVTSVDLTEGNNLNKFLARVGMENVGVGEAIDLDVLIGHPFVGAVIIKKGKNDKSNNDLGDITVPEYNRWLADQGAVPASPAPTRTPSAVPKAAPAQVAQPNATPKVARPANPVTTPKPVPGAAPAFRPNAPKPAPKAVAPVELEGEGDQQGSGVEQFPD